MILGGVDAKGARMYYLDYLTCMHSLDKVSHGHGGNFLLGLLDNIWTPGMTREEGIALARRCCEEV